MPANDDELLAAYLDGIGELTAEERARVEALLRDRPELRAEAHATRDVLGQLRGLPAPGAEPDWSALERRIRVAVGPTVPRSWWRTHMTWLLPIGIVATAAAATLVWLHRTPEPAPIARVTPIDAGAPTPTAAAPATAMVWLDGEAIELGDTEPDLDVLEVEARAAFGEPHDHAGNDALGGTLLPISDLGWIDGLDDAAMDRAETWLAHRKKKT